jgi:beta-N-acetylhexosaminidase
MRIRIAASLVILLLLGVVNLATSFGDSTTRTPRTVQISTLTPSQLAGERVIYSYSGFTPPAALVARIKTGEAAGVIFFQNNIASASQLKGVIAGLQSDAMQSPVKLPLLMLTDQEGGQVRRLSGAPQLSEKQIGMSAAANAAATDAGREAAVNLEGSGINVNLAPVLDVYRQAGNFIDRYGRSYSDIPSRVAQLGADFIRAQQRAGVAATAKHFPGLGAAARNQDTDLSPVTLNVPLTTLRSVDELPYRAAIGSGVKLVMVSWARYPALDPSRPAGLSDTVVQGELRGRLAFKGVTVTDALSAGALKAYGNTSERAVMAAQAGMDLLLCASQQVGEGTSALGALTHGLGSGSLDNSAFTASVKRVLALRRSL